MSERQWKPGDVAMVKVGGRELFCTFYDTGAERGWFHGLGYTDRHYVAQVRDADARPLVVIDPESGEAVKRLCDAYRSVDHGVGTAPMQAALREFANPKPPKPEEPTGWGAVVEASDGWLWTLIAPDSKMWANYGARGYRTYDEIDVVRIVGEGVTP